MIPFRIVSDTLAPATHQQALQIQSMHASEEAIARDATIAENTKTGPKK